MKTISVLGATGSVGQQALDVARSRGYRVDYITANRDVAAAELAAREFHPSCVAMASTEAASDLRARLADTDITVLAGEEGIREGIYASSSSVVVNSIIGEAGLLPTLTVIDSGKRLALANKESLVIAGSIVMQRARARGVEILPVDSEHSAIFQSLKSGKPSEIKRILLTASGGPFYKKSREELARVTLADTLAHPTWKMGKKITVDSATLMNKGFEVIEAAHLFGVGADRIKVLVHRESILHSAVEYIDNTVIAELSVPDMRMCVQYAVDYPDRCPTSSAQLDLISLGSLTFAEPDTEAFPLLALAARAMSCGGAMPAILNAADEVAVAAFLEERIGFLGISEVVSETFERLLGSRAETVEELIACDREARRIARELIGK
ncbi:MAG: 1-deoxy-D-xylulose-5-phosphate reductoisomerase [Clostridia bacterium]|nr:1-deoxy-D-xylulose-5-phosphate reductoisomerase [Clostridia bacterium]